METSRVLGLYWPPHTEMGLSVSSPLSGVESEGKSPPLPCLSFADVQGPPAD